MFTRNIYTKSKIYIGICFLIRNIEFGVWNRYGVNEIDNCGILVSPLRVCGFNAHLFSILRLPGSERTVGVDEVMFYTGEDSTQHRN